MDKSSIQKKFKEIFGENPEVVVRAPGRVNLIGEHIDYNGGPVLPMAINKGIIIAGARRNDNKLRITSLHTNNEYLGELPVKYSEDKNWANYCLGVIHELSGKYTEIPGFNALIYSDIPTGAGLSSSAALEVATAKLILAFIGEDMSPLDIALLSQRAENRFVGVNCGLMDQASSACAVADHALLLDCAVPEYSQVKFPADKLTVMIAHSGVKRGLTSSAYNERRSQCDESLKLINEYSGDNYPNLSAVPYEAYRRVAERLPAVLQDRSRHVIRETERVQFAVDMFINEDLDGVGCMLNESHYSLRDKYEVSCEELDILTDLARNFSGVYGSRLTGAGFGGCTVTLVHPDEADDLMDYLMRNYYTPRRIDIVPFVSTPAQGAEII